MQIQFLKLSLTLLHFVHQFSLQLLNLTILYKIDSISNIHSPTKIKAKTLTKPEPDSNPKYSKISFV